jgi:hypothetical protein
LFETRVDRRLTIHRNGLRQVVVIVRERNGESVPAGLRTEGKAGSWIKARIAKGTVVNADGATSWDGMVSMHTLRSGARELQRRCARATVRLEVSNAAIPQPECAISGQP